MASNVICGDCFNVLPTLPAESVDLVVTSPPYADQRKDSYDGVAAGYYVRWFLPISLLILSVLKPAGSLVLNIKEHCEDGERQTYVLELVLAMRQQGWRWVDEYVWNKTNPVPTGSQRRLKDGWERCHHFAKTKDYQFYPDAVRYKSTSKWAGTNERRKNKSAFSTHNGSGFVMGRRVVGDMVRPSNVITTPSSCINIGHPATFPIALPEFFIKLMTLPEQVVLDPFMGSGTTLLACEKLGRFGIGIDMKPEYCELAKRRLAERANLQAA
jgi:site-specific DNA-methyltransferase (adenine-specific)/site-specific DNA-methyltransferase (cytosine-N4-specific)